MNERATGRYRMTLEDGVSVASGAVRDDDGAMREARIAACEILRDELREGLCPLTITICVTAPGGRRVGAVSVTGSMEQAPNGLDRVGHALLPHPTVMSERVPRQGGSCGILQATVSTDSPLRAGATDPSAASSAAVP